MVRYNVAVVGATGAVGQEMVNILEERDFPVNQLKLLASERSIGKSFEFKGKEIPVEVLNKNSFEGINIALFSAGKDVSLEYVPYAVKGGTVVIDNTSAFRMNEEVPLVVPEINSEKLFLNRSKIVANPNCSTIQLVMVLKPIHDVAKIKRVVVSTYQAVSGAGRRAIDELYNQIIALFNGKDLVPEVFPHQIAFNCIPQIGDFLDNRYSVEEMKIINETKKILNDPSIKITATTVRVPVMNGHSESVNIETEFKLTVNEVIEILNKAQGVEVVDEPQNKVYPLNLDASGNDNVFVGRIREDESVKNGLNMWIVADNLRKGAALNAVQIAEFFIKYKLI